MKRISDKEIYLTDNPKIANEWQEKLHICRNCKNYIANDLFSGSCAACELVDFDSPTFNVDYESLCEFFIAKEKVIEYWLRKLGQIIMDYDGTSDFIRENYK